MIGRNDPCPCGSGKKYKKCCLATGGGQMADDPREGAAMVARAADLQRRGQIEPAVRLYRQALDRRPRDVTALAGLAEICANAGDRIEAIGLLERAVAVEGSRLVLLVRLAALLQLEGRGDDAIAAAARAVAVAPENAVAHSLLAGAYERRRRYDEATAAARRALELDPTDTTAGILLGGLLRRAGAAPASRNHLETLLARPDLDPLLRSEALNELGRTLEDLGDHEAAFDAFRRCNEGSARDPAARRVDASFCPRRLRLYRDGFTPDLLARWRRDPPVDDLPAPAFLMGFARAGTTLTEQVMAAHPDIVTSNEKPIIRHVEASLLRMAGETDDVPAALAALDEDGVRSLRAYFWEEARRFTGPDLDGRVFVHKQPMNTMDVGLINTLFPDARVILALRDPRDVCLSCFQQLFRPNIVNVHFFTLEDTVRLYADVMEFWLHVRDMLTLTCLPVRYEDTVADLGAQARRILDLLGVPWNDEVLRFHEHARRRTISTPSYADVARPVTAGAVGRWRRYERHFTPLLPRLQPFVEAFGYDEQTGERRRVTRS